MILPASQDGAAHQSIKPESTWTAAWQIDQPPATLWYHPHPHGQTELQVSRGMAGLFLIGDDASSDLPSEYGVDDIPLIIQDVTTQSGGTLPGTPTTAPIGRIGNTVIVNGTHQPHFQASTSVVRFRILNASAARCYNLELATRDRFYLVGTDGGLLASPVPLTSLLISPGERAEVLIPIARDADLILRSVPHDLGMSRGANIASGAEDTLEILRITPALKR
jgi:FtsP/CotA-like multicopper oxidase with cupredoxin domain